MSSIAASISIAAGSVSATGGSGAKTGGSGAESRRTRGSICHRNTVRGVVSYRDTDHIMQGITDMVMTANELSLTTPTMEEMQRMDRM